MQTLIKFGVQKGIHPALPLDPASAFESLGHNQDFEMSFSPAARVHVAFIVNK
jgi:hypothetical protein